MSNKAKINVVYILDSSGSMAGDKYNEGKLGFLSEIKTLATNPEVDYSYTLVEFSTGVVTHLFKETNIEKVLGKTEGIQCQMGWTALNDAVAQTLLKLIGSYKDGEKTIVSIITDGAENKSNFYNKLQVKDLITASEGLGFTITFIGTEFDSQQAVVNYGIKYSNTYSHDNTGAGFEKMSKMRTSSMMSYSSNVARGADVSEDFFQPKNN